MMFKDAVVSRAMVGPAWLKSMFPKESTWKRSPEPTVRRASGEASPMPTLPEGVSILKYSLFACEMTNG